jgi:hypothetical protein
MVTARMTRRLALVIFMAAVLCASATSTLADSPLPAQVLSNYENYWAANIARDCGYSQALPSDPSTSLWLFCDTGVHGSNSQLQWRWLAQINGSTGAEGPFASGEVPSRLSELPTPGSGMPAMPNHDGPAQFLPTPAGLVTSGGLTCDPANGAYPASWISGVTQDAANPSDVLISYVNYCVPIEPGSSELTGEGFGLAAYDPVSNTLDSQMTVFASRGGQPLGPQLLLGSPVFSGSHLFLFASYCPRRNRVDLACTAGSGGNAVYLARVGATPASWQKASDFRWYVSSSSWTRSASSATSVIPAATPLAVNVENFSSLGHGLVLIEQTDGVGDFTVYQASAPTGAWSELTSGKVPCAIEGDSFCRAIFGHPELSTGSKLLVSYFDPAATPHYNPAAGPEGHVMVRAFPW